MVYYMEQPTKFLRNPVPVGHSQSLTSRTPLNVRRTLRLFMTRTLSHKNGVNLDKLSISETHIAHPEISSISLRCSSLLRHSPHTLESATQLKLCFIRSLIRSRTLYFVCIPSGSRCDERPTTKWSSPFANRLSDRHMLSRIEFLV